MQMIIIMNWALRLIYYKLCIQNLKTFRISGIMVLINKKSNREERCSHMKSYLETFTEAAGNLFTEKPEPSFDNAQAVSYQSLLTADM